MDSKAKELVGLLACLFVWPFVLAGYLAWWLGNRLTGKPRPFVSPPF